jgi:predicted adenylyl cyclase CyaB
VFYRRPDKSGPKRCDYTIEKYARGDTSLQGFKTLLAAALGVRTVVDKRREIYFIGNIKFHIDTVDKLGAFFEIEAIGNGNTDVRELENQCRQWLTKLGIDSGSLVDVSYSDMLAGT